MYKFTKLFVTISILLLITILINGCGLIMSGTNTNVTLNSHQSKTKVYINGQYMGTAPLILKLDSTRSHIVEFRKKGYEPRVFQLTSSISGGYVILDILFGFWPIIFDAATGGWKTLDYNSINANLEKKSLDDEDEDEDNNEDEN